MALHLVGRRSEDKANRISLSRKVSARNISLLLVSALCIMGASNLRADSGALTLTANLPTGIVGSTYSGLITATGGVAPYKFALSDGALPPGLVLNSSGTLTGTPSTAITKYFWVRGTDSQGATTRLHAQITISTAPPSSVSLTVSPTSTTLVSGSTQQFTATVQGTSNTAVSWSSTAGTVSSSGMFTAPSVSVTTMVTVIATSAANTTKKASATVTVNPSGSTISVSVTPTSASLSSGNTQQFSATVQGTSNTAVTWSATAGAVSSSGMFTAPTVSSNTNVTVTATSSANATKKSSATVVVSPASTTLTITTSSVPGAQSGSAYSFLISASGGKTPYQWKIASGSLPQGFVLSSTGLLSGTTTQQGPFSFTAQATDAGNSTASKTFSLAVSAPPPPPTSGSSDGPAALPVTYMQTALANTPAPGTTMVVSAGGNLQSALNNASCGDTIELAAGATFSGTFTLPAKACDNLHWIIVRTSAPNSALPPEGSRMLPCYAGVSSLPGRPAFNCASLQNVLAKVVFAQYGSGPFQLAAGANHYRLLGLDITRTPGSGLVGSLVSNARGATSSHIILDRVWLHGSPQDDTMSGFNVNGMTYGALVDSYSSDFHCTSGTGACTDAHVVAGGTSSTADGVYRITGNFLEASGENILFGGGGATLTPTDLEIRQNHFFKPLTWMSGQPGFVGGPSGNPFIVKNHLELKNAQRVLVEGNIFENSWGGYSQVGYSILLTPKNQAGANGTNLCPICAVTDVTIRYNTISHVGAGISLANVTSNNNGTALYGARYSIHDVTIDDISGSKYKGSGTLLMVLSGWATNPLNNVFVNHITGFPDPASRIIDLGNSLTDPRMYGFTFTNNIIGQSQYPIWSTGGGPSNCAYFDVPLISLNACFSSYKFSDNALIATNGNYPASKWPSSNYYPTSASLVAFVNFNGGNRGNYQLLAGSPYANAGSDGKDLGADINAIQSLIAGVY